MNPPQVYMCSPSWTLLPPPSPFHPSGALYAGQPWESCRATPKLLSNGEIQLLQHLGSENLQKPDAVCKDVLCFLHIPFSPPFFFFLLYWCKGRYTGRGKKGTFPITFLSLPLHICQGNICLSPNESATRAVKMAIITTTRLSSHSIPRRTGLAYQIQVRPVHSRHIIFECFKRVCSRGIPCWAYILI